ncbi:MAG: hypothetical protein BZ138_05985 [Methanosphaera sp. rholeuAM270]|nr:MAG: hypothetical protein BZ138_05985 [Methanosphaera sp. rholeuAM270]
MATIRVAVDNIRGIYSVDKQTLDSFASALRNAGHTVTTHGVGPNKIQTTMLSSSNACDLMIQVAGGRCLGTLIDFYTGIKNGYYHAKAGGFAYFKCWDPNWKAGRAGDDNFSWSMNLSKYIGKTLPEIYSMLDGKMFYGYGNTAEDCAKTFLANYNGTGSSTKSTMTMGSSALDLIKQCTNDWDKYGIEYHLQGDTLKINRTILNTDIALPSKYISNTSIIIKDHDGDTPNTLERNGRKYTIPRLVQRYGEILVEEDLPELGIQQMLNIARRGHGHTIDLQCLISPDYQEGKWVRLELPEYGINHEPYFISKATYDNDVFMSLTLDVAPPSRFVEVQEPEATDTESEEDEEVEEEE